MTPADQPERPKADTDQAKQAAKRQAADAPPDDGKSDEGTRPGDLTSENDGGGRGVIAAHHAEQIQRVPLTATNLLPFALH